MKINSFHQEFINQSIYRMMENTPRIQTCLDKLTEEEVWQKPNGSSNSIGNLILHLCGNITQYIISSLGGLEDHRVRDLEFEASGGWSKNQLMSKLSETVNQSVAIMEKATEEELLRVRAVQCYEFSGIANIIHVVEHYSYHTGQIAFWTKLLKDQDLKFYDGIDLNQKG